MRRTRGKNRSRRIVGYATRKDGNNTYDNLVLQTVQRDEEEDKLAKLREVNMEKRGPLVKVCTLHGLKEAARKQSCIDES